MIDYEKHDVLNSIQDIGNTISNKGQKIRRYVDEIKRNKPEKMDMVPQLERLLDSLRQAHSEAEMTYDFLSRK